MITLFFDYSGPEAKPAAEAHPPTTKAPVVVL
jgi:hypothetical protein